MVTRPLLPRPLRVRRALKPGESKLSAKIESDRDAMVALARTLNGISAGELVLSDRQQQDIPPDLRHAVQRLVRSLKARIDAAAPMETRDELTATLSMSAFRKAVTERLSRASRPCALLLIDLDGLKRVNDTRGHPAGDQLLALAASRITSALDVAHLKHGGRHAGPLIGRLGGGEFAALIDVGTIAAAERCARDILHSLQEPFFISRQGLLIGANIGLALAPEHGRYYDHLLRHAELATHEAKSLGRNGLFVFEQRLAERAQQRANMEAMLRCALIESQFELHFQPQVRARQEHRRDVEALIRWRHPEHGIIMPGDFITIAEESGLICEIGRWVLSTAVQTIARWQSAGLSCRVAVNVSMHELTRSDFVDHAREWLARTGAPPHLLEIEVTESAMMTPDRVLLDSLSQLHQLGIGLAIDDFGTGYSNFARLSRLPVNRLKIDRSLVEGVLEGVTQREVLSCIVQLGKTLGHEVVVEGVESEAQAALFKAMGCDLLQGFHLSRPLPEHELMAWLRGSDASPRDGVAA